MMELEITKKKGIDDFVREYTPQQAEEEGEVITEGSTLMRDLFTRFEKCLNLDDYNREWRIYQQFQDILPPDTINRFMQLSSGYKHDKYLSTIDPTLTKLINNSFLAGNNDFHFEPLGQPSQLNHLAGTPDNRIRITIDGSLAEGSLYELLYSQITYNGEAPDTSIYRCSNSHFQIKSAARQVGSYAKNCTFDIYGDVGPEFGGGMKDCSVIIYGNCDYSFAFNANNCCFRVYGDVERGACSGAHESTFIFHGEAPMDFCQYSKFCTFATYNEDFYKALTEVSMYHPNRILLLKDGKIEETLGGIV